MKYILLRNNKWSGEAEDYGSIMSIYNMLRDNISNYIVKTEDDYRKDKLKDRMLQLILNK